MSMTGGAIKIEPRDVLKTCQDQDFCDDSVVRWDQVGVDHELLLL